MIEITPLLPFVDKALTVRQLAVFLFLSKNPNVSNRAVCEALKLNGPAIVRACDSLIDLGWLKRKLPPSDADQRLVVLSLTKKGQEVARAAA